MTVLSFDGGSFRRFLKEVIGHEKTRDFLNPVKSNYQVNLESRGWTYVTNEEANNYHKGIDLPEEPLKDSLRRVRSYYEENFPDRRIRIFRAYNIYGERIPFPAKNSREYLGFEKTVIVAVYTKIKD